MGDTTPDLAQAWNVTQDQRTAREPSFQNRKTEWFIPGRQRVDRRPAEPPGEFFRRKLAQIADPQASAVKVWDAAGRMALVPGQTNRPPKVSDGPRQALDILGFIPEPARAEDEILFPGRSERCAGSAIGNYPHTTERTIVPRERVQHRL